MCVSLHFPLPLLRLPHAQASHANTELHTNGSLEGERERETEADVHYMIIKSYLVICVITEAVIEGIRRATEVNNRHTAMYGTASCYGQQIHDGALEHAHLSTFA